MTTQTAAPQAWHDSKRYLWLLSPMVPGIAVIAFALYLAFGWGLLLWMGPLLVYVIIPTLDFLIGEDSSNPPESAVEQLENDRYYRYIVYSYIPLQLAVTAVGTWFAINGNLQTWELVGLVFSLGTINGIAINTSHELGHKREGLDRFLAKLTLAPVAYGHFFVEHNRGHHKNVATPDDPASSKMGESFWRFLPRTVIGSVQSAWHIEAERLQRQGKSAWSLDNENLQAWAMTVVFYGAITAWLGWPALGILALQAAYGISLLEVINYVEHYGLLRQKDASGRYERCQPHHSWNSNHVVTNLFLYQLQRHSDHHANPVRAFQALRHFENSPQLPSGYASMLLPAYIPFLWYRLMDKRVVAHFNGDLTKANVLPQARERLYRTWNVKAPAASGAQVAAGAAPVASFAAGKYVRYQCPGCGFVYDERQGCAQEGFVPGTRWAQIPDSWSCPDCAVRDKVDFRPVE